jgi:hypothetical protein
LSDNSKSFRKKPGYQKTKNNIQADPNREKRRTSNHQREPVVVLRELEMVGEEILANKTL